MARVDFLGLVATKGLVPKDIAQDLARQYRNDPLEALPALLESGRANREQLGRLVGDAHGVAYVNLAKTLFQREAVRLLPKAAAQRLAVIPLYLVENTLAIAMIDPGNATATMEVERLTGKRVDPLFSFPDEVADAISIEYSSVDTLAELSAKIEHLLTKRLGGKLAAGKDDEPLSLETLQKTAGNEAVVELVQTVLLVAIRDRASDIHIEPQEDVVRVRFRVDGVLHEWLMLSRDILPPFISRMKIISGLDIAEHRRPQDGRFSLKLAAQSIDFRVSIVPSIFGESAVLRILGSLERQKVPLLEEIGFRQHELTKLKKAIAAPNGVLLVTGPTGSGKSTTLYAALNSINKPDRKVLTIEDPVEYRLKGLNQFQVNTAVGFNFATALRSFLRQDPDVILVGEIRDQETAKIAVEAALTGHLVMSTLHANGAIETISRFLELGVDSSLVTAAMRAVLAQRLVRKICERCRESYVLDPLERDELFEDAAEREVRFFRGKGCLSCHNTGYSGRLALHEMLMVDRVVRQHIIDGASLIAIDEYARANGSFRPLRYDGVFKVLRGFTTMDEVNRVSFSE